MRKITKTPCSVCLHFAKKRGEERDCSTCRPSLLLANMDAVKIWNLVQDQVIVAPMGGVVGINILAAYETMDRLGIKNTIS